MPVLPRGGRIPPLMTVGGYGTAGQPLVSNGPSAPASFQNQVIPITVGAPVTTTSSTMGNVTGFSFAIAALETWVVEFNLYCTGATAGTGMVFQLTGPASPTFVRVFTQGDSTGVTLVSTDSQTAFGTPTQPYIVGAFSGYVRIMATIQNGGASGTVQLQFASNTNTQQNTIEQGSYMNARKVS